MTPQIVHQLQISGPNGDQTFELPTGTAVTGRQPGVDLQLEHKLISRRHANFTCTEEACTITDLKSSNGTKVNETRLAPNEPHLLKNGDVIEIGSFKLTYTQVKIELAPELEEKAVAEEAEEIALTPEPERPFAAEAPPPPIQPPDTQSESPPPYQPPPGLALDRSQYLKYLPDIYHTDFMARFLAMFESIYIPARWNVDNFDVFLNPRTAPDGFFPWLASWFELTFDNSWNDEQRRTLLAEANELFARRGTKKALSRILEIYTAQTPVIDDTNDDLEPFTFTVNLPLKKSEVNVALIEALIDQHKPAYTNYDLKLKR
jgi:phage tail-like protein